MRQRLVSQITHPRQSEQLNPRGAVDPCFQGVTASDESSCYPRLLEILLPIDPARCQAERIGDRTRSVSKLLLKPSEARGQVSQHALSGAMKVIDVAMAVRLVE